jgi:hypothetical protein
MAVRRVPRYPPDAAAASVGGPDLRLFQINVSTALRLRRSTPAEVIVDTGAGDHAVVASGGLGGRPADRNGEDGGKQRLREVLV